jgi:hypothetical protein
MTVSVNGTRVLEMLSDEGDSVTVPADTTWLVHISLSNGANETAGIRLNGDVIIGNGEDGSGHTSHAKFLFTAGDTLETTFSRSADNSFENEMPIATISGWEI